MDTSSSTSGVSASETSADAESTTGPGPCSEVHEGDLTYLDSDPDAVRDIRKVTGRLSVFGTELEDLTPFECLEEVGVLHILNNPNLTSLTGLGRLESVTGGVPSWATGIGIAGNPQLETLAGLDSLRELEALGVSDNESLQSVDLEHVEHLGLLGLGTCAMFSSDGSSTEGNNPALTSIDGFAKLHSLDTLSINGQNSVTSIAGLQQLADNGVAFGAANFRLNEALDVAQIEAFMAVAGALGDVCGNLGDRAVCKCPEVGG